MVEAIGVSEPLSCEGETIVVNLHGALILTAVGLRVGTMIDLQVYLTSNRTRAKVVYVNPEQPRQSGIALAEPQNIWGISLPPEDWRDGESE